MRIARCHAVRRELRDLGKNRPGVEDAVKSLERLLSVDKPPPGAIYSGLSLLRNGVNATVVKYKVMVPKSHGGKQSGIRYVCELLEVAGEKWAICLSVHMHEGKDDESTYRSTYRGRFDSFALDMIESYEVKYPRNF